MTDQPDVAKLTDALHRLFLRRDHPALARFMEIWPKDPAPRVRQPARDLPVTAFLPEAIRNAPAETARILRDLAEEAAQLGWNQTYQPEDLGEFFLSRYGWTTMFGAGGYVESDVLLSGFLLLGPDLEYPVHRHSPEEVYIVLSGEASWKIGEADWQVKPAGTLIHNPPWQLHGMRTDRGQPLVLAYLFNAGEVEKSQIVG